MSYVEYEVPCGRDVRDCRTEPMRWVLDGWPFDQSPPGMPPGLREELVAAGWWQDAGRWVCGAHARPVGGYTAAVTGVLCAGFS